MHPRAPILYWLFIKAAAHRLRYDFARELVVGICAAVLTATFFYIFNDFLNVEVKALSEPMRLVFARAGAVSLLAAATWGCARSLASAGRVPTESIAGAAARLGESPQAIAGFMVLRGATIVAAYFLPAWVVINRYLVQPPMAMAVVIQVILLVVAALAARRPRRTTAIGNRRSIAIGNAGLFTALWRWRWLQICYRNRITQFCLFLGFLFLLLTGLLAVNGAPLFVLVFACFVTGSFVAMSIAFQVQEDLEHAWVERSLGVSHDVYINSYVRIAALLSLLFGGGAAAAFLLRGLSSTGVDFATATDALKLVAVTAVPCLMMPYLVLQIDGRRPAIQAILVILVGLFISTAIFAHWLGVMVLVLAMYYGGTLQAGRFYRA